MRWLRFSIMTLMGLVLVIGVGIAALKFPSQFLAASLFMLTLGVLSTAILGVAFSRGPKRAWWSGFALFGWGYLGLVGKVASPINVQPHQVLTGALLEVFYRRLHPGEVQELGGQFGGVLQSTFHSEFFMLSAHSILAIIVGIIGASIGFSLATQRNQEGQDEAACR